MVQVLTVGLNDRPYPIHIGPGSWDRLADHISSSLPSGIFLVTDGRVDSLYGNRIWERISGLGVAVHRYVFPEGEASKSFVQLEAVCREMASSELDRGCLVLALGGGVVGDLAGFTASVYLRGVRLVQLPTTLLAMVDSSVGGKTGINIPEGKNLVGSFYQPEAVFADTDCLSTLESRDWYSGLAEAIKTGLTMDVPLFEYLESVNDLSQGGDLDITRVVAASCERKADIVRLDEREGGLRKALNFGHTLAHAIEASIGYGVLRHGEAVLLGMAAAVRLSAGVLSLPHDEMERALRLIRRIPVPDVKVPSDLGQYLARDKKSVRKTLQAVLIDAIGSYRFVPLEDPGALIKALEQE